MIRVKSTQNSRESQRGQAMTEFVIWAFVLLLMISGILWFGKAYDLKLQCLMASRYMAWSHAQTPETDLEPSVIMSRVQRYYPMTDNNATYAQINPTDLFAASSLTGDVSSPSSGGFDLMSLMSDMFNVASNTQGWNVGAVYAPGGILDTTLPGGSHVQSQHFVSGGSWHKKQMDGDEIIVGVKQGLFLWSIAVL